VDVRDRWESVSTGDGRWQPPAARAAATMVLLRDKRVLLLKRSMTMPFAPGMHVFPGGGVSSEDLREADPLKACAIRETVEEVDIALSDCRLFDRWVTPEVEDRRYDVSFFFAFTEDEGRLVTTEADDLVWLEPLTALELHHRGELPMLRPTAVVLQAFADGLADGNAVAATKPMPKLPRMRPDGTWDILHAETYEVLQARVAGPARAETDGATMPEVS